MENTENVTIENYLKKIGFEEEDIEYIQNVNFVTDCKIVFKTVSKVLKKEGISRYKYRNNGKI